MKTSSRPDPLGAPARRAGTGSGRHPAHQAPGSTHDAQSLRTIGLLFRSLNFNFRQEMDKALRKGGLGLSFGEISPMLVLELHPGINGAQLARHSMVSAQAMNSVLRKLVEKKYVERRPHPESLRADSWHLTAKGLALIDRARTIFEVTTSRMLSGLSVQETRNLQKYLRSCAAALNDRNSKPVPSVLSRMMAEFPHADDRYVGRPYRYGFMQATDPTKPYNAEKAGPIMGFFFNTFLTMDMQTGEADTWFAGDTSSTQEPVFAPRSAGAPEGEGYVMGVVNRRAEHRSDLVILDAQRMRAGPIATIKIPVRLKYGIHGNWVPAAQP